ncbi:unnamed protein product, partial [Medioppia subpectinata]
DCGSSLVNPDSDNEQTEQISQPLSRRKSSLNEINIASINCEHNNNNNNTSARNTANNVNESQNHRLVGQHVFNNSDNDSDYEDVKYDAEYDDQNTSENKTVVNFIEYKYLVNLFNDSCDGRVGDYMRSIVKDFRYIFSLTLLMIAMVIVVKSLVPIAFPCECRHSQSNSVIISY